MTESTIIYTHTDEAPLLATYSLLPVVQAYAAQAGVSVVTRDISLAGRILAGFPERLRGDQKVEDALAELGGTCSPPRPTSSSCRTSRRPCPQLKAAIAELQGKGYDIPDFPEDPQTDDQRDALARYRKVLGSAVNPVLRQGNSDRRAPASVKHYAQTHPHRMGAWSPDSRTNVAHMEGGDFLSNERSAVMADRRRPTSRAGGRGRHDHRTAVTPCRSWPARWSMPPSCRCASCGPSSNARSPGPRLRTCSSRSI